MRQMPQCTNTLGNFVFMRKSRTVATGTMRTISMGMSGQLTVWYDGSCPLCLREIAFMRKLDKRERIAFVDVSENAPTNCPIDQSELLARFHAREDGKVLSGAAAFAAMWRAIPVLRPLGLLARNQLVLGALERLYVVFLRYRPRLQRWVADRS